MSLFTDDTVEEITFDYKFDPEAVWYRTLPRISRLAGPISYTVGLEKLLCREWYSR